MTTVSLLASLALLAAMSALGVALLGRVAPFLVPLERVAYGAPIGMVLGTLAMVPLGATLGFGPAGVAAVGLGCATIAAGLALPSGFRKPRLPRIHLLGLLVIGALAARWAVFWRAAVPIEDGSLWAGHVNLWGDWPVHFGVVSSFAYGGNFPPEHPRFADHPFAYHFLADLTASAQVVLGMTPGDALALHSWIGCVLAALALYAFARRLTRRRAAAALAVVLFVFGGGLGWFATAEIAARSGDLLGTLERSAWDYHWKRDLNLEIVNLYYGFLAPQRAFLYGLPIAFASLTALLVAVRRRRLAVFVVAGAIAGLLPLAHLATLLAFAILVPVLFLLFPSRGWLAFGAAAVVVALPQLVGQLGGGVGALSAMRIQLGWVAPPDLWPVFWLKNLGLFAPLLVVALARRRLLPPRTRRFMVGFMALFIVVNVVAFQPWDWDDHKVLVYWFVALDILAAALLVDLWRRRGSAVRTAAIRAAIAVAIASLTLSGALEDLGQALGQSRYRMLDAQQIALGEQVRERTPPDALFVVGMRNHDPVAMLTGRRIFVGYPNWLWTEGVRYEDREAISRSIYHDIAAAGPLLAANDIDFVVVGPYERRELGADEAVFRARYPIVAETRDWLVFDVRAATSSAGR